MQLRCSGRAMRKCFAFGLCSTIAAVNGSPMLAFAAASRDEKGSRCGSFSSHALLLAGRVPIQNPSRRCPRNCRRRARLKKRPTRCMHGPSGFWMACSVLFGAFSSHWAFDCPGRPTKPRPASQETCRDRWPCRAQPLLFNPCGGLGRMSLLPGESFLSCRPRLKRLPPVRPVMRRTCRL